MTDTTSEFKSKRGLRRIANAIRYSLDGFHAAWKYEHAFRQELLVVIIGTVTALALPISAFQKLFLETELVAGEDALLCRRRPRAPDQEPVWGVHVLAVDGETLGDLQYETSRSQFLGRGRSFADPRALDATIKLSNTLGAVLDPIFSLRRQVRVPRESSVSLAFTTGLVESRAEAIALAPAASRCSRWSADSAL